ncbi:MAG: CoB--CoM heterodisulfide reductase iron-sulfur subunit A family protein [Spirochaetaceae bacterium]|nr:MAG: CoB--CoM heterodisulfide reductase iron-sulfur subunit A family protein [Spirochaetaceae bacterium]
MDKRILVIGGGIAGVQASLDLAEMGIPVTLVEEKPSIGGRMSQLDKTFPTNDCSTCILSPKLVELGSHPNITLRAYSTVEQVERVGGNAAGGGKRCNGTDGGYEALIRSRARYVNEEKCTACGLCAEKCPVKIPDLFNRGIVSTKCIGIPYAQAVPAVYRIDAAHCLYLTKGKCGNCAKVCPAGAVDFQQTDRLESETFASVILAAGCEEYTPRIRPEFGYGVYANVITSIEYERLLSASGPTGGKILRFSDGEEPRRVAFLQCVGSRDPAAADRGYCSSYCCMQATKDAIITREHLPESDAAIFYIDLRAFGKDFDKFVDRAKEEYRVRYVKSRVSEVIEDLETGNLSIHIIDPQGSVGIETFDLVVLSVGIGVPASVRTLLASMGVQTDAYGFCRGQEELAPVSSNLPGVYVCGTLTGPMDIPETVVSASAAAARAARGLLERGEDTGNESPVATEVTAATRPPTAPGELEGAPLHVGVIVCRCGVNIASVVDVSAVAERAAALPNVVFSHELTYACSQDSIQLIIEKIGELCLSRLVVASCSPRTHEHLFRAALQKAGLNKYLLQMTNIRDQCSWVHQADPQGATEKAFDLVRMAVARARFHQPLEELESAVNSRCLVIGGGLAGMSAALTVADNGFPVSLVEREQQLGGNLRQLGFTLETDNVPVLLDGLSCKIQEHPLIDVYLGSTLDSVEGYIGNFRSTLSRDETVVEHGTVIVATGGLEHQTTCYGYGSDPYIVTQREFETMLLHDNPLLSRLDGVVMIQCVDSREGDHNYCSRICCGEAVKNALRFKREYPRANVTVLYRDVRTYGLAEDRYAEARKAGVLFLRYTEDRKPEVSKENGDFKISLYDEILGREIAIQAQLLVLSVGIDAPEGNREIARLLKVPLNEDGFFLEAHVKLRPVDFATDGVFVCGLAHGPKYARESVAQALAAAGRAMTVLSRRRISAEAATARVFEQRCSGCALCMEVCPYGAIEVDPERKIAVVNALLCKGCGSCVATCFSGAIDVSGFSNRQIIREFEELLVR